MARLGIVGFTNSGKSTLFNALTRLDAETGSHPYTTTEPLPGVARIHDPVLEEAARLENSIKVVPATLELLDLPALPRPGEAGASPGGQYLARLRDVDALVMVVRAFVDETVPFGGGAIDPVGQAEELLLELAVADHEVLARRAERLGKEVTADQSKRTDHAAVTAAATHLSEGYPLRSRDWDRDVLEALRDSAPLTLKPAVWVVNVDESAGDVGAVVRQIEELVPRGDVVVAVSALIEEEGARLAEADRVELFEGLGLGEGALARIVPAAYQSLGLISFYTVGPKESRAWTVRAGALAPEAAGRIHSDLQRGFIRAEIAPINDVIQAGGWDSAKKLGRIRVEGKGYEVAPGDVLVIRFSV